MRGKPGELWPDSSDANEMRPEEVGEIDSDVALEGVDGLNFDVDVFLEPPSRIDDVLVDGREPK